MLHFGPNRPNLLVCVLGSCRFDVIIRPFLYSPHRFIFQDPEPKGSIDLKGKKLEFGLKGLKKDFAFSVTEKEELFVGSFSTEAEMNAWKKGSRDRSSNSLD